MSTMAVSRQCGLIFLLCSLALSLELGVSQSTSYTCEDPCRAPSSGPCKALSTGVCYPYDEQFDDDQCPPNTVLCEETGDDDSNDTTTTTTTEASTTSTSTSTTTTTEEPEVNQTVWERMKSEPNLSILVTIIEKGSKDLQDRLDSGNENSTVCAPSDDAFEKEGISSGKVDNISDDELDDLIERVRAHIYNGSASAGDVVGNIESGNQEWRPETIAGQKATFAQDNDGDVFFNEGKIVSADNKATNGILHVIDRVIQPANGTIGEAAMAASQLTNIVALLEELDLLDDVNDPEESLTLLAPLDDGFDDVENLKNDSSLEKFVKHHIVRRTAFSRILQDGDKLKAMDGSEVAVTVKDGKMEFDNVPVAVENVPGTNGVCHVILRPIIRQSKPDGNEDEDDLGAADQLATGSRMIFSALLALGVSLSFFLL